MCEWHSELAGWLMTFSRSVTQYSRTRKRLLLNLKTSTAVDIHTRRQRIWVKSFQDFILKCANGTVNWLFG